MRAVERATWVKSYMLYFGGEGYTALFKGG